MVFLRTTPAFETTQPITGHGLILRAPQNQDYPAWAELRALSREHLTPWEPVWPRDDLSRSAYRRRLRHYSREARDDHGYAFFVFEVVTQSSKQRNKKNTKKSTKNQRIKECTSLAN